MVIIRTSPSFAARASNRIFKNTTYTKTLYMKLCNNGCIPEVVDFITTH